MATLVAYGMPQKNIALHSASGAPLHKTLHFDSKNFTGKVRDGFEKALGVALQRFIGSEVPDVSQATYLFTPDIQKDQASHTSTSLGATVQQSALCLRRLFLASPSELFAGNGLTISRSIHPR